MLSVLENPPENSIYPLKRQEKNASEIVCWSRLLQIIA